LPGSANVVFEPGCKKQPGIHIRGGQILVATNREQAYYQEKEKAIQLLHAEMLLALLRYCAIGMVLHPGSEFTHIAINPILKKV
jgi:hypothetical protein